MIHITNFIISNKLVSLPSTECLNSFTSSSKSITMVRLGVKLGKKPTQKKPDMPVLSEVLTTDATTPLLSTAGVQNIVQNTSVARY